MSLVIESRVKDCTGIIVIDSFYDGSSSGGTRIASDVSLEEIKALAREMTFKFRFFDLKRGGAKCGFKVPEGISQKHLRSVLREYGSTIAPVIAKGIYYPGADLGCGHEELTAIYHGAGFKLGPQPDSSYYTAMTVGTAVEVCKEYLYGTESNVRVAIEGFGKVGTHLAARLDPARYRIVAVSTAQGARYTEEGFDTIDLLKARRQHGDDFVRFLLKGSIIDKKEVLTADVEILVPAARTWSIRMDNARAIRARIIVPAANVPYAQGTVEILAEKGVLCLPGFVSNVGGVFGTSLNDRGMKEREIEEIVYRFYRPLIKSLVLHSESSGISPIVLTEEYVLKEKLHGAKALSDRKNLLQEVKRLVTKNYFVQRRKNTCYVEGVLRNMVAITKRLKL